MSDTQIDNTMQRPKSREISLLAVIGKTLKSPKTLFKFLGVAGAIGALIAFTTPKIYMSTAVLAPEITGNSSLSGNLSDIASSFGIDIGGGGNGGMDAIYPEIYPDVLSSPDFLLPLLDVPVCLKNDTTTRTYRHHLRYERKVALKDKPKKWINKLLGSEGGDAAAAGGDGDVNPLVMSRIDSKLCTALAKSIDCAVNKKTSVITLSFTDQDPMVAAIMLDTIQARLQEYIIEYRTAKARKDYDYYKQLNEEAKVQYEAAQRAYAAYCDANIGVARQRNIEMRNTLENEMNNAFSIMNQTFAQATLAEAKIRECTPAFTIVQRPKMPYKAAGMSRIMVIFLYMFLGAILDAVWVNWVRDWWRNRKQKKPSA